ncbi:MAG: D-2-hydroxyacid dehydrogenase [Usitatibacter sp.]
MRIFLSEKSAAELRPEIETIFAGRPFEIVKGGDFEAAFVSREVTGKSTKFELEPQTQAFHDALRQAKSLKWVQIHSAGADRPIYPELQSRGVVITTSSGASASIVAQSALAGILALGRKLPQLMEQQRAKQWKSLITNLPPDLAGQTAVILGWGPIGQSLAAWLSAIGLKIIVVRNTANKAGNHPTFTYDQILEAAPKADWLVIACPLSEKTEKLINKQVLTSLPPGAHVINVGRGEIIEEEALIQRLKERQIAGAYLDVFNKEPLGPDSPLWDIPNVIVTPHSAGHSAGNEGRVAKIFLENLAHQVEGRPLRNKAE